MTARDPRELQGAQNFAPLPPSNFNRDELLQWLSEQTVSAQKLITGSLQADQEISSSNFESGTAGWQIDGDGNAEFNDVTVRGDIESGNWDGDSPADVPDTGASAGFYLDSSLGSAQFEGDIHVEGTVYTTSTPASGGHIRLTGGANSARISFRDGGSEVGYIEKVTTADMQIHSDAELDIDVNGGTDQWTIGAQLLGEGQLASAPTYSFLGDADTGIYRSSADVIGFASGGSASMLVGAQVNIVTPNTTGSAANLHRSAAGLGPIVRSTSSLKYKPDWRWAKDAVDYELPTPIRWADEKGQLRLGFGAEHVWKAVPEAYEYEIYDLRSLVAILSEKVKRLELLNPQATG